MALAAAVPICGWFLAACVSSTVAWGLQDSPLTHANSNLGKGKRRAIYARSLSSGRSTVRQAGQVPGHFHASSTNVSMTAGLASGGTLQASNFLGNAGQENCLRSSSDSGSRIRLPCPEKRRSAVRSDRRAGQAVAVAVQPVKEVAEPKKTAVKQRRVVVTGLGVVSCLGHDPTTFYDSLLAGKSGITTIEGFNVEDFPTKIAGEIKEFSTDGYVNPKMAKRMDKFMWYLLTAGKRALEDAGMTAAELERLDKSKCGILIGSAMGGMQVFNDAIEALRVSYRRMNPFCIPFVTTNMGSAMLAMDLGWMGPNYSISTACATGNYCILSAANHIIRGEADVMLSGGSDAAILPIGLGGFVACRALSKRNDEPARASRPWDSDRDGFVMGEGAGVLVMEELEHAKSRGATIYAEFLGGSFSCDAYHMTEPHPDGFGVHLCIEQALKSSGVKREDVNYINAHATSTQAGDLQEYKAIVKSFGGNEELKINSTKSMIGHLLGAAGAVEAIATVQAIRTGYIHPNLNVENPEKLVDLNLLVGSEKEEMDIKVALSNSFGFGGHNSSILFAPYQEDGYEKHSA